MALIPPDAGLRLRLQTEANPLQPVRPAHEIPADLPELLPGQTFSARIQEALPDNTYKALVAGRQLTLQLPEGAKAGDDLQLVVIDRSAKAIIARQVEAGGPPATGSAGPYPFMQFSPAARLISQLLPAEGERAAPALLNRGEPLLPQPPSSPTAAAELAPRLARAVEQSGLFYEAHQAQWVAGKLPLERLLQEPQGRHSSSAAFHAAAEAATRAHHTSETANTLSASSASLGGPEKLGAGGTAPAGSEPAARAGQAGTPAQAVAEELRPLVQQQLEAIATQRLVWHGEIWPRQLLEWEIEWEGEREGGEGGEEALQWSTSLSLTTPRLGRIDARLRLSHEGVSILLATPYGASAADLRDEAPKLAAALEAAGVPLTGFQVRHEELPLAGEAA